MKVGNDPGLALQASDGERKKTKKEDEDVLFAANFEGVELYLSAAKIDRATDEYRHRAITGL